MTKSELIERIAQKQSQLAYRDVELAVKTILEHMAERLANGDRIEIRDAGGDVLEAADSPELDESGQAATVTEALSRREWAGDQPLESTVCRVVVDDGDPTDGGPAPDQRRGDGGAVGVGHGRAHQRSGGHLRPRRG